MHSCIDGAMFVLIMKLLMCYNDLYVLSKINCLTLDTVVTLFLFISLSVPNSIYLFIYRWYPGDSIYLFIYHRVPISIYLSQSTYFNLFFYLFIYRRIPISIYSSQCMGQHLRVTGRLSARD